ncbi:unnamed protein product [Parnassius mnemosyne]|uniref:Uncharacterized protein n=1 Tax=Parnassius mnemosyne TaxID=213953 RepID=A0AAV1L6V6_9NEOP
MLKLLIKLSALCIGLSHATSTTCQKLQQTQLTSLNERMNQMIEALYSSLLSKPKSSSSETESSSESATGLNYSPSTVSYETAYYPQAYSMPVTAAPQYIYYSPSQPPVPTALPFAPPLLPNPPMPLPPPPLPNSYYSLPSEPPVPSLEYPYSLKTGHAWPSIYSYEQYSYPQLPYSPPGLYSPPSPPVSHSPPQYSHPTPPRSYEYKFYPTEYPPPSSPPRPYQPVPSPPHYAPLPEYPTPPPAHSYSNPQYPGYPIYSY